jgi:hypothetical protein
MKEDENMPQGPVVRRAVPAVRAPPAVEAQQALPAVQAPPALPAVQAPPALPAVQAPPALPAVQAPPAMPAVQALPAVQAPPSPLFIPAPDDEAPGSPGAPLPPPPGFQDDVWSPDMQKYVVEALLEPGESWERVVEEDTHARQMVRVDRYISASEKRQREDREAEEAEHELRLVRMRQERLAEQCRLHEEKMKKEKRQWERVKALQAREAEEAEERQRQRRRQQEEKDRETVAKLAQDTRTYQRDDLENAHRSILEWKREQEAKKKHEEHELMWKERFEDEERKVKEEKRMKVIELHNRKVLLEDELENLEYIVKDRVTGEKLTEEEMEKRRTDIMEELNTLDYNLSLARKAL